MTPTELLDAARKIIELGELATDLGEWELEKGTYPMVVSEEGGEVAWSDCGCPTEMLHDDAAYIVAACNAAVAMARRLLELEGEKVIQAKPEPSMKCRWAHLQYYGHRDCVHIGEVSKHLFVYCDRCQAKHRTAGNGKLPR